MGTRRQRGRQEPGNTEDPLYHAKGHRFRSKGQDGVWENVTQGNGDVINVASGVSFRRHYGGWVGMPPSLDEKASEGLPAASGRESMRT